jgi:hypothetical protein
MAGNHYPWTLCESTALRIAKEALVIPSKERLDDMVTENGGLELAPVADCTMSEFDCTDVRSRLHSGRVGYRLIMSLPPLSAKYAMRQRAQSSIHRTDHRRCEPREPQPSWEGIRHEVDV